MNKKANKKPSRKEAEEAVRTLIKWAGEDVKREGLIDTPKRVVNAYTDWFSGYEEDPKELLKRTFSETGGYDEVIMLKDIRIESHCEHHIAPFIGNAHVAYLPNKRVVGISKLARITNIFAKRMQVQEKLTSQIATCIQECLKPRGVSMVTSKLLGKFRTDASTRREFYSMLNQGPILKKN